MTDDTPRTEAGRALAMLDAVSAASYVGVSFPGADDDILAIDAEALEDIAERVRGLRYSAQTLCDFAGRHIAGDSDVLPEDVHVAIEEVRAVLALFSDRETTDTERIVP